MILKNPYLEVDSVDLSEDCSSLTIADTTTDVDVTTFGPSFYMEYDLGLRDAVITAIFLQDFEAGAVHATLAPLARSGDTFKVVIRPVNAPSSATNPEWHLTSRLYNYSPLAGKAGDAVTVTVDFRNASSDGLVELQGETTIS